MIVCAYALTTVHIIYFVSLCVCRWCRKHYSLWFTFEHEDFYCHSLFDYHIVKTHLPFHLFMSPMCSFAFSLVALEIPFPQFTLFELRFFWVAFVCRAIYECILLFCCCYFFFYYFYYVVKYLCSHEFYSQWIFTYKLTLSSLFPSLSVRIVFKKKWWYANVMIPFDFNAFVKKMVSENFLKSLLML